MLRPRIPARSSAAPSAAPATTLREQLFPQKRYRVTILYTSGNVGHEFHEAGNISDVINLLHQQKVKKLFKGVKVTTTGQNGRYFIIMPKGYPCYIIEKVPT